VERLTFDAFDLGNGDANQLANLKAGELARADHSPNLLIRAIPSRGEGLR
jgi:hypothetical protein